MDHMARQKQVGFIYHKIPKKKKPRGLYFSKALFEGLLFRGAYLQREICVSKLIKLALYLEVNLLFLLCFIFQVGAPGGLIFGGVINGGFFA